MINPMKVSFELTMPNVASWNGKWSGADKKYYRIKSFLSKKDKERITELLNGRDRSSWYYRWEDGWGASVIVEIVDASEARKRQNKSAGFCGYEWMISSILKHGEIYASCDEIPEQAKLI
jgi:hypothetical protein